MPDNQGRCPRLRKPCIKLGLARDIDLALHLPLRYEDETRIVKLRDAREGDMAQIEATVTACEIAYRPRRQLLVTVDDGSDTCVLRFFSFYPSQQKALAVGTRVRLRGELKGGFLGWQMVHPSFKPAGGELPAALTPVYPTVGRPAAGLPAQGGAERAGAGRPVRHLPAGRHRNAQAAWCGACARRCTFLHHPTPDVALATLEDRSHPAWQRLKAEELLAQQLSQLQSKRERDGAALARPARPGRQGLHEQLLAALPFQLTAAQQRVGEEIARDLARHVPMHRLLQGDVGSGKTVVAALAAAIAIDAGWQCALMAPTEILAEQHFRKLIGWLEPLLAPRGPAGGLADRQPEEEGARRDAGADRQRRGGAGGRHARRDPGAGAVQEPGRWPSSTSSTASASRSGWPCGQRCRRPGRSRIC